MNRTSPAPFRGFLLASVLLASFSATAFAAEGLGRARLVVSKAPEGRVIRVRWDETALPVREEQVAGKSRFFVDLRGVLEEEDSSLIYNGAKVPLHGTSNGPAFSIPVPLNGRETFVNLTLMGKRGAPAEEEIDIIYDGWGSPHSQAGNEVPPARRFKSSVGAAFSYLRYVESGSATDNVDLTELGLTGKYNALYLLSPDRWELSGNLFGTLLPIELSPGGLPAARWYGANARVGYHLPVDSVKGTEFWVMTGWYFWGMWGLPSGSYGIQSLSGPQVFLNARVTPAHGRAFSVYFKYASIEDYADVFSFSNREIALGGAVLLGTAWNTHPIGATLDISDAKYANSSLTESMHLVTIGAGVNFGL